MDVFEGKIKAEEEFYDQFSIENPNCYRTDIDLGFNIKEEVLDSIEVKNNSDNDLVLKRKTFNSEGFQSGRKKSKSQCGIDYQTCCYCGKHFIHTILLTDHIYVYHFLQNNSKSVKIVKKRNKKHNICSKIFQKIKDVRKRSQTSFHIQEKVRKNSENSNKKSFMCKICTKFFARKDSLTRHLKIHSGVKLFKCDFCSKQFTYSVNLKKHQRIHIGEKPFKCEICSKSFTHSFSLKVHLTTHTGEKAFECKICSKKFTLLSNLTKHLRIHNGEKRFKCEICLKLFTRKDSLNRHIRLHTGEKPFECKICSKSFTLACNLKKHIRIHTGEKPFKCKICSKCFTQSTSVHAHMITHTGEKPFKCQICYNQFTHTSSLKKHLKSHAKKNNVSLIFFQESLKSTDNKFSILPFSLSML